MSIIQQNQLSKADIQSMSEAAINEILSGEINPLEAETRLKALEDVIKAIRSNNDVKGAVMTEAEKYGKQFDAFGCSIQIVSRKTKNYKTCNDEVYNNLSSALKAREAMLDAGIDPSTGESLNKPMESVSEYLKIAFK